MSGFLEVCSYPAFILRGVSWTLLISLIAIVGGSVIGMAAALMKMSKNKILRAAAVVYIDFFRTTPLLVQLMWFYFVLPLILGVSMSNLACGAVGMCLYAGAYIAEVFRSGILAVPRGQTEAAKSIGMRKVQTLVRIVLPQGIVKTLPPLATTFVTMIKDSSICSIIGINELVRQTNALGSYTLLRMESLTVAGIIYFLIAFPLTKLIDHMHRKYI